MLGNLTGESFLIAISGIVIVFIMLAVLCAFIPLISRCVQMVESRGRKAAPAKPAAPAAASTGGIDLGSITASLMKKSG